MRKLSFVGILATLAMVISMLAPAVRAAGQPPIYTDYFFEGEGGWGPVDADPAVAYDTASGKLIFNSYQGLIALNGELHSAFVPALATNVPTRQDITMVVTNVSAVGADLTDTAWTDGTTTYVCKGWVDELGDGFGDGDVVYLSDGTTWRTWTVDSVSGTSTITLSMWRGSYVFNIRTSPTIYFYDSTGAHAGTFSVS